jgi:membrane protease YdiL (CAAX protease family)
MLIAFFLLAYALTWVLFTTVAIAMPASTPAGYAMVLLGAFSPAIAALTLTSLADGRQGVRALLGRLSIVDVSARYYFFALTFMLGVKMSVAGLHRVLLGVWPRVDAADLLLMPFAVLLSWPIQAGEEIGWRGYALPRLTARFGSARASLLLGVLWACWHLPQFYIAGADTYHQSLLVWAPQVVALSVVSAWLYERTGRSLALVMLLHAAVNNTKDIVPSGQQPPPGVFSLHASAVSWLTLAVLWMVSGVLLARMKRPEVAI